MAHQLSFEQMLHYNTSKDGITLAPWAIVVQQTFQFAAVFS